MIGMRLFPIGSRGALVLLAAFLVLSGAGGLLIQPALAGGGHHGKPHKVKAVKSKVYRTRPRKAKALKIRPVRTMARGSRPHGIAPADIRISRPKKKLQQPLQTRAVPRPKLRAVPAHARAHPPSSSLASSKPLKARRGLPSRPEPDLRVPSEVRAGLRTRHMRSASHRHTRRAGHEVSSRTVRPIVRSIPHRPLSAARPLPASHRQTIRPDRARKRPLPGAGKDRAGAVAPLSPAVARGAPDAAPAVHGLPGRVRAREDLRLKPDLHPFRQPGRRLTMWERRTGRPAPVHQLRHLAPAPERVHDRRAAHRARHHARKHARARHKAHRHARHHRHHHHRLVHGHRHYHYHHHHAILAYSYFPIFHPVYGWYDPWPHAIFAYYGHWPVWIHDVPPWLRWRFWVAHYRLYGSYPHEYCPHSVAVLAYLGYAGDDDGYDDGYDYADDYDGDYADDYDEVAYGGEADEDCPDDD